MEASFLEGGNRNITCNVPDDEPLMSRDYIFYSLVIVCLVLYGNIGRINYFFILQNCVCLIREFIDRTLVL